MTATDRLRLVITAGPTREHLDPVRFLSNPSTGKMGFALARAAARRGHEVTLIAGPVALKTPAGVRRVDVVSAREMLAEAAAALGAGADAFIAVAAVADWRPARCARRKLRKGEMTGMLRLERNPDILKTLSRRFARQVKFFGFAAQTGELLAEAARKCREKRLEFIVANDVTEPDAGFGVDTNRVVIVGRDGSVRPLALMTKAVLAGRLIREIEAVLR